MMTMITYVCNSENDICKKISDVRLAVTGAFCNGTNLSCKCTIIMYETKTNEKICVYNEQNSFTDLKNLTRVTGYMYLNI